MPQESATDRSDFTFDQLSLGKTHTSVEYEGRYKHNVLHLRRLPNLTFFFEDLYLIPLTVNLGQGGLFSTSSHCQLKQSMW